MPVGTAKSTSVSDHEIGDGRCVPLGPMKLMVPAVTPKLEPWARTNVLHGPKVGSSELTTGCGTDGDVGVDVGPGVFVATGVRVGVAVAPSGAKALKPEVLHG